MTCVVFVLTIQIERRQCCLGDTSHKAKFFKWKKKYLLHHNFQDNKDLVSPWHDIPLYNTEDRSNQTLNMVVEIPRFTQVPIMSTFGKGRKEEEEEETIQ